MAHFAKIDETTKEVLQVLYIEDSKILDSNNQESESVGQTYLETHNNWPANLWIKTSYQTSENKHKTGGTAFRGNYAAIGYVWDENNSIFWPPQPFSSWIKDISSATWKSPIEMPTLTEEQENQNAALTHLWSYDWDENAYQTDDTTGWTLTNSLV